METPHSVPQPNARPRRVPSLEASLFLLVLAIVLFGALQYFQHFWQQRMRASAYQAVFLTNGQVYFGKLQKSQGPEVILDNVYYLQTTGTAQPATGQASNTNAAVSTNTSANTNAPQYSLVKLGQELHGPTNRMYINREQILFTEDLRSDSQVTRTIQNELKK